MAKTRVPLWSCFIVRFQVGNRLGAGSRYSIKELCIHIFDRYGFTNSEIQAVVALKPGESVTTAGVYIKRDK